MKKKISTNHIVEKVTVALNGTKNNVPRSIKETFTFKGRKSPEVIEKVLLALTENDNTVLDPFLGSGMSLIASQNINRKFVGVELDNYTYSVVKTLFEKVDYDTLQTYY